MFKKKKVEEEYKIKHPISAEEAGQLSDVRNSEIEAEYEKMKEVLSDPNVTFPDVCRNLNRIYSSIRYDAKWFGTHQLDINIVCDHYTERQNVFVGNEWTYSDSWRRFKRLYEENVQTQVIDALQRNGFEVHRTQSSSNLIYIRW